MIADLKDGQKVRIARRVRVGEEEWNSEVVGVFLGRDRQPTGIHTDRVVKDDIYVETLLIEKENGERSVIALDEFTKVEPI
jgi:hypothetical protein